MVNLNVTREPCSCTEVDGELIVGEFCVSAPQISDSMIETDIVAQARGTAELDATCTNRMTLNCTGHIIGYVEPGSFGHINDGEHTYPCVVDACEITVKKDGELFEVSTHINFEREDV